MQGYLINYGKKVPSDDFIKCLYKFTLYTFLFYTIHRQIKILDFLYLHIA